MVKLHPYRNLAHGIRASASGDRPQVLGMSASLTYAVGRTAVQRALASLCHDLDATEMISVSEDELRAGGYDPPPFEEIEILPPSPAVPASVLPEADRKPHLMHSTFMRRVHRGQATAFARQLHSVVLALERAAASAVASFESPLAGASLSSWEGYAHALAAKHASSAALFEKLEVYYVALRVLVQTWEEEEELVVNWLRMSHALDIESFVGVEQRPLVRSLMATCESEANHSKVARLKAQLVQKGSRFGEDFRGVVFVQQRITALILAERINGDAELRNLGFAAGFVAAKGASITPSIKVSPTAARDCIQKFREGEVNVLVATSVIEEGFDVPAANVVISFDRLKDSVELCQRIGRARSMNRAIVIMAERPDRPVARLDEVRLEQDAQIAAFTPAETARDLAAEQTAQRSRERGAVSVLTNPTGSPMADLTQFAKKTKARLTEDYHKDDAAWVCNMGYHTVLRQLSSRGQAGSKKLAKKTCAAALLLQLKAALQAGQ